MTFEAREHPHRDSFVRKLRNERAPPRVTARVFDPGSLVHCQKVLVAGVGHEPAPRMLLRREKAVASISRGMRVAVVGELVPQLLRDEHRARVAPFGIRRIEADFGARSVLAIEHVTESQLSDLTDS